MAERHMVEIRSGDGIDLIARFIDVGTVGGLIMKFTAAFVEEVEVIVSPVEG